MRRESEPELIKAGDEEKAHNSVNKDSARNEKIPLKTKTCEPRCAVPDQELHEVSSYTYFFSSN